jgi:hypothetical protein
VYIYILASGLWVTPVSALSFHHSTRRFTASLFGFPPCQHPPPFVAAEIWTMWRFGNWAMFDFFWMTSHSPKLLFMKRRNVSVIVYGTRNHSATDLTTSRDAVAEDQASYLRLHWDPPGMRVPHGPTKKKPKIHWVHRWKLPFWGKFIIHLVYLSLSDDQYCVYLCIRILRN